RRDPEVVPGLGQPGRCRGGRLRAGCLGRGSRPGQRCRGRAAAGPSHRERGTAMTETAEQPTAVANRYPLSQTQEFWCERAAVGSFGPRFLVTNGFRITGPIDEVALQGALNDLVERHELLRTIVVHEADPHYQQVYPPCP